MCYTYNKCYTNKTQFKLCFVVQLLRLHIRIVCLFVFKSYGKFNEGKNKKEEKRERDQE